MRKNFSKWIFILTIFAATPIFAEVVQIPEPQKARDLLVETAKSYAGTPYEYGAIGPDSFDCSGFIFTVSRESIGVQLPRTSKALYAFVEIIPQNQLEPGDIVFFRTTGNNSISHAGIYIGKSQFMHAVSDGPNTGVIISSLNENSWKRDYAGAGRFLPSGKQSVTSETVAEKIESESLTEEKSEKVEETVAESKKSEKTSNKEAQKTTSTAKKKSKSNGNSSSAFLSSLVFDCSTGVDWSLFTSNRFYLNFRGVPIIANIYKPDWPLGLGIYTGARINTACEIVQIPFALSFTPNEYFRCYAGPVFGLGKAVLPGDDDTEIESSIFPGIIGFAWNTPSFIKGDVKISLCQDISYSVFNKTDGSALSPKNSFVSGFSFSTGLRVTLPFSLFF